MHAFLVPALLTFAAADPASPAPQAGATQTVEVDGEHACLGVDAATAKELAREDGLRKAVEQVGTTISSSTMVEGNQIVADRILLHASGYVKKWSYTAPDESTCTVGGGSVRVHIRAEVGVAELDKDLEAVKAILARKEKPRTVILVSEQSVGMAEPMAWWSKGQKDAKGDLVAMNLGTFENTYIDAVKDNGWTFVDHDAIEGKLRTHSAFSTDLSVPEVIEFGKLSGAEVAIVGRVVATSPGPSELAGGMMIANAAVSLRVINCDNGEILDTESMTVGDITTLDSSASSAGQKALKMAGQAVAKRVQQRILERWQGELGGTARVTMHVTGIASYRALQDFEGALGSYRGVRNVTERRSEGAEADLDLDLASSPKLLARQIDGKSVKGKTVNVKKVSANDIVVSIGK